MLKYVSILLIGLSFSVNGQSASDDFGDFLDYTVKNEKTNVEYQNSIKEIADDISIIALKSNRFKQ